MPSVVNVDMNVDGDEQATGDEQSRRGPSATPEHPSPARQTRDHVTVIARLAG